MAVAKYLCRECKKSFCWLEDFINHVKEEHPRKRPLEYTSLWKGKTLTDLLERDLPNEGCGLGSNG